MRLARILLVLAVLAVLSTTASAAKTIIYVDQAATGAKTGANWKDAFVFLQDALTLAAATPDTEIEMRVAQGVYRTDQSQGNPAGTLDPAATFTVQAGVTLLGGYAGGADELAYNPETYKTVLSGTFREHPNPEQHSYHVVSASWNSIIQDVIIAGGWALGAGADAAYPAIRPLGDGFPTLVNVKFRNNRSILGLDVVPEAGTTESFRTNTLMITLKPTDYFIQPGEAILFSIGAFNLNARANLCGIAIQYPEQNPGALFLPADRGLILAGGGYWMTVLNLNLAVADRINMIVGTGPWGDTGTDADGTVAWVSLLSNGTEGCANIALVAADSTLTNAPGYPLPPTGPITTLTPMNVVDQALTVVVDGTAPQIQIDQARSVTDLDTELLLQPPTNCTTGSNCTTDPEVPDGWPEAGEGNVFITVHATDPAPAPGVCVSGLAAAPMVVVTTAAGTVYDITGTGRPVGDHDWVYTFSVAKTTDAGLARITACVADLAGNRICTTRHLVLAPVLRITGLVQLEGFVGSYERPTTPREVLFVATDATGQALGCWRQTLEFDHHGFASYSLDASGIDPKEIVNLSAKTAWHLRTRVAVNKDQIGLLVADFLDANKLRSGDLLGGGTRNYPQNAATLHYVETSPLGNGNVGILDVAFVQSNFGTGVYNYWADIDGDGVVQQRDINLVTTNLGESDDPQ